MNLMVFHYCTMPNRDYDLLRLAMVLACSQPWCTEPLYIFCHPVPCLAWLPCPVLLAHSPLTRVPTVKTGIWQKEKALSLTSNINHSRKHISFPPTGAELLLFLNICGEMFLVLATLMGEILLEYTSVVKAPIIIFSSLSWASETWKYLWAIYL